MTPVRHTMRGEVLAAAVTLLALLAWEAGGWDLPVSQLYGNADGFAWRDVWWARVLLHEGGRWLAGIVLALQVWDAARPIVPGPTRAQRWYWLAVVVVSMLLVPMLKRFSATSCPWELALFGGAAAYVPHWLPGVTDGGPGHCFPSGHAVGAFAFFGLYFLWRPYRPTLARVALMLTLAAGALFGWTQLVRGAHLVSHTLWSGWVCWAVATAAQTLATWEPREAAAHREHQQHQERKRPRLAGPKGST